MPTETIWTALPRGITRTSLSLSVHVTPRLTAPGDATLADFPAMKTWPPPDLSLDVLVNGVTFQGADVVIRSVADPAVWAGLFPATTYVKPHLVLDHTATLLESFPADKIHGFLEQVYSSAMITSPTDHLALDQLLALGFDDIGYHTRVAADRWNGARQQMLATLAADRVIDTRAPSTPTFDFVQLAEFHAPADLSDPKVTAIFDEPVRLPRLDFHAAVQFANQHPALMRLLGLVLDVEVTVDPTTLAGPVTVEVKPSAPALAGTTVRTPLTHAEVTDRAFHAVPRPGTAHLAPGWMRLDDPAQFAVRCLDASGGGLKAINFAGTLQTKRAHPVDGSPNTAPLPALRHDGFSVVRLGKAHATHGTFLQGAANEAALAADTLELYLDDLVRGTRIDVWDSTSSRWHSLMARTGEYRLLHDTLVVPVRDEGFLGTTASKKVGSDDVCIAEEVCWWDGWSLVAPRPGSVLGIDPAADEPLIDRPGNDPGPDFDAGIRFDVTPGTLPRLRFGTHYRFRARLVDLAGNSRPLGDPTDQFATAAHTFRRFEPASAPPVLHRRPKGPGESVETVVLRSALGTADPPTAERHLVPRKVGQMTVELHALLDADTDDATYTMLADMDDATLADPDPDAPDRDLWYDVDEVPTTWAPDPLSSGIALEMLDGPFAGQRVTSTYDQWPKQRAARLVVSEGSDPPKYDALSSVVHVTMPAGEIWHARLSSRVDPSMLDRHGLWDWLSDALPPGPQGDQQRALLQQYAVDGKLCALEPYRRLTLMHAVRQPLLSPEFPGTLSATRDALSTRAKLRGMLQFHRHSTTRVDILASWTDPLDVDPLGQTTRNVVDQTACSLPMRYDGPDTFDLDGTTHEFGDTLHHVVTYRGVATSRFVEQFSSSATFTFPGAGASTALDTGSPAAGVVPGSVKLSATGATGERMVLVEGRHFSVDAPSGTVAFTDPGDGVPAVGAEVTAVFVVPPVTRETEPPPAGIGPKLVSVPSSARPAAPKVHSVLPTFGWEQDDLTEGGEVVGRTSTRRGAGVRVYLERPWWSSGEGELLGVVLWPPGQQPPDPEAEIVDDPEQQQPDDPRRPFVTMWGQDPIYGSRDLPTRHPGRDRFPLAVPPTGKDAGLSLAELGSNPGLGVEVAGHTVTFDPSRKLWSCDITLDIGAAYSPMVRLALARWQPASIPYAELSPVVLADVIRLAPDRFATVLFGDDDTSIEVQLTGTTHTKTAASAHTNPGSAWVTVEEAGGAVDGELGWEPVGAPMELTASLLNGVGTWTGQVTLPGPRTEGNYRLVVEQFERLAAEPMTKNTHNPDITIPVPTPRLVHTDIVPLS